MELEQMSLPVNNKLLSAYWSGSEKLHTFFEYKLHDTAFHKRAQYLKNMHYNTNELSNIIRSFMEPFGLSPKVNEHLSHLADGAKVIVGGQQAGILTGPLYSIHKAITVILLAKEQSEKLGEKILPLFWIAGEDHDLEEINHTYTIVAGEPKKRAYSERTVRKTMASTTDLNKAEMKKTINKIFKDFGETKYSNELYQFVVNEMDKSATFTDFFARLMNAFFKDEGLLMIDAAFIPFRKYESTFFKNIIEHNEKIAEVVVAKEQLLNDSGYGTPIEANVNNANLFYVRDGERFLLERRNNHFVNDQANVKFTKEELLNIAEQTPENLSNNVVTRPLMQEMTLPVLAFVGGPGELAYWATLKDAFSVLNLQMPIIVPRLNLTIVTRQVEQILAEKQLSVLDVITGKSDHLKRQFIESIQDEEAKKKIDKLYKIIDAQYEDLERHLIEQQIDLKQIVDKNKNYHLQQFDYLKSKIEQQVLLKHDNIIRQFNIIATEIFPNNNYQERVYNPYQYINVYGPTFVEDLLKLPFAITNNHYIVRL
ncbi:hypothetical protein CD30_02260 [Ureibacillus massiliensis 4400831 = CIP 108448 = CCUG 49529]|uniref:Putative cysteine ligase BshC n=1 Tax=Ureibacillus massiliensis 4400831 = CIP 108448 = CCUG 49529 TaxID=1211035 RepID=A0A0A3J546_9BACL|nr:bacillithiol biosynthesis cysteine-adding enzyme BshC [Ureibacillus massiliensis]KGR92169.1 hypothetical protein CD30_02260 [Ureibacillus massiliensis 4400831 = CIP 108448 = CCUG 49529]